MDKKESEAEWEKSRRVEAERMKAAKALNENKDDAANLSYLDLESTKIKGWSTDANVILASAEKIGNRSIVLAFAGVALGVIGYAGGVVGSAFNLGMASVMVSGIPSGAGFLCMGISVLMAIIAIGSEVANKIKNRRKFSSTFYSAIGAIMIVLFYTLAQWLIIRFS